MKFVNFKFNQKATFHQAKANGWKASNESINSFVNNIMDRFNNLIGQTRV
ncbi:hypothetical protein [Campylobacter jejuni]|nr:hypothetical protein [Campylobacter jejuni]